MAGPEIDATSTSSRRSHRIDFCKASLGYGVAICCYGFASVLAYWPTSIFSTQRIVTCGCDDIATQAWFLAWTPYAIAHGLNPLWTSWINVPHGVNLMANTSMPFLGAAFSPVTASLGPVAAFNFSMRAAFFLSALSMFFCLHRLVRSRFAALVGGLLYGFSPYMAGQANGHLNLLFVPIPPLVGLVLIEIFVRRRWKPVIAGFVFAALLDAQFYVSAEIFVNTILFAVIGLLIAALTHSGEAIGRLRAALPVLGWAVGFLIIGIGYGVWFQLVGPQHISGAAQPFIGIWAFRSDLLGLIVPTASQRFGPAHLIAIGSGYAGGNVPENGTYLGLPILIVVVAVVVWLRRHAIVVFAGILGAVAFVLSLGPTLFVDNHDTHIPMPFFFYRYLPLIDNEVPIRYTLFVQLFVAVIVAAGIAQVMGVLRRSNERSGRSARLRSRSLGVALGIVVAGALVPLVPRFPIHNAPSGTPQFFVADATRMIPSGSVVLTYPYPVNPDNFAMLWQAQADFRFKILGDYAFTPQPDGKGTTAPPLLAPSTVQRLFEYAMFDDHSPVGKPPPFRMHTLVEIRTFLSNYQVGTVIASPFGDHFEMVRRYLTASIGPAQSVGGVLVWYHVKSDLERPLPPSPSVSNIGSARR